MRSGHQHLRHFVTIALCTLPLWVYGILCGSTGHDDAHINIWNAWTLLTHGEIINYNGERLEQTTSLLLDVFTALFAFITPLSLVTSGYLVNLLGAVTAIVLTYLMAQHIGLVRPWLPALLTALTPYFAYWAWSGMDTTLSAAAVISFLYATQCFVRKPTAIVSSALWLTALALAGTRPEMMVVGTAFMVIAALLLRQPSLLVFLTAFLALALWRHAYFGVWFPNPVYAKSGSPDPQQIQRGLEYFLRLFRQPVAAVGASITLLLLLASVIRFLQKQQHTLATLCLLWVLIYGGFIITSGGDWMKEGRFWVPLIAPLWLTLCANFPAGKSSLLVRFALPALLMIYTPTFINTYSLGTPIWQFRTQQKIANTDASFFEIANREHLRDWPALRAIQKQIRQINPSPKQPLVLMSKQMGMVNYHLFTEFGNRLRVWDMAGLVDNSLRNCAVMAQDGFDKQGLRINYRKFFERLPQAQQDCGLRAPDIIYDIYGWGETTPLPDFLREQGYAIILNQTGRVDMKPGINITAHEVVAIRQALLTEPKPATIHINFNQLLTR